MNETKFNHKYNVGDTVYWPNYRSREEIIKTEITAVHFISNPEYDVYCTRTDMRNTNGFVREDSLCISHEEALNKIKDLLAAEVDWKIRLIS